MAANDDDLLVVRDWVTPEQEDALCTEALRATRGLLSSQRRTVRYNHGIPAWLDDLAQRLLREGFMKRPAENAQVSLYAPGQGLAAHIDAVDAGDEIAVLSLMHRTQMRWTLSDRAAEVLDMPARSLVLVRGARRWQWKHEVLPADESCISVVFRYRNPGCPH